MLTPSQITLNASASFDLWPAQILGASVKNAKVQAVVDADTAALFADVAATHASVYPTLPAGTPNRFDAYPYVKLKLLNGQQAIIGLPWIKEDSWQQSLNQKLKITIDNVNPQDFNRIVTALSANGFNPAYDWET